MAKNRYEIKNGYIDLCLMGRGGQFVTKISPEDLERVINNRYSWSAMQCTNKTKIYATSYGDRKAGTSLHRFLMEDHLFANGVVDHINGDTLDNRRSNLRVVSHSANMQNRHGAHKNSKSGVRGVYWCKDKSSWRARIGVNGKEIHVGRFRTLQEADIAVREARAKYMPYSQEALQYNGGASF